MSPWELDTSPVCSTWFKAVMHIPYTANDPVRESQRVSVWLLVGRNNTTACVIFHMQWNIAARFVFPYIPWKILRPCGRQRRQAERKDRRQRLRQRGVQSSKLLRLRCKAVMAADRCIRMHEFTQTCQTHTVKRSPGMVVVACRPELGSALTWFKNVSRSRSHPKSGSSVMTYHHQRQNARWMGLCLFLVDGCEK